MKQVIPFVKDIKFNTRLSEITSIALEHNLQMENSDSIVGNFVISGNYKINDISINEEKFEQTIPFDITLDDKYDMSKVQIDIDDFYYEIVNDEILRVHIDVLANNLTYLKEEVKEVIETLEEPELIIPEEVASSNMINDKELLKQDNNKVLSTSNETRNSEKEEIKEDNRETNHENKVVSSITNEILKTEEKYVTYKIHIVRENETVDDILQKYNVCKEELQKYNDLENIILGNKLIIPALKNE